MESVGWIRGKRPKGLSEVALFFSLKRAYRHNDCCDRYDRFGVLAAYTPGWVTQWLELSGPQICEPNAAIILKILKKRSF